MDPVAAFMEACLDAGCVVVPVRAYSQWNDECNVSDDRNPAEAYSLGAKYVALCPSDDVAVMPDPFFYIDEGVSDPKAFKATPEEALRCFIEECREERP